MTEHHSEHGHHGLIGGPVMGDKTKEQIHSIVERIDQTHREKEHRLDQNRKKLISFFDSLGRYASEFEKDLRKSDYKIVAEPVPGAEFVARLRVLRSGDELANMMLRGFPTSDMAEVKSVRVPQDPMGTSLGVVDDGLNRRITAQMVQLIEAAGKRINNI